MISKYSGIFLISLSTLVYQILLTRIFSVTMGYHFAFMAISLAMFGLSAGSVYVYINRQTLIGENYENKLGKFSILFSITTLISFILHLYIPFVHGFSVLSIIIIVFTYTIISVPFIFSGICISIILTLKKKDVNKYYAADLCGAAIGCVLVVVILNYPGGLSGVFFAASLSALAALFWLRRSSLKIKNACIVYTVLILSFAVLHSFLESEQKAIFRIQWVRGEYINKPLFEKWNSISRISVDGDSTKPEVPFGWGLSDKYDRNKKVQQLMLNVDSYSTTVLSKFDGDTSKLFHLRYDISNLVHSVRKNAEVLVIGSGAGRDVLSSIYFNQKSVLAIEINKDMISTSNKIFKGFTGGLDEYPKVKFVGDEARSYIQSIDDKFDIMQVSVIDNWSASSSGAFVLTENALYTIETWKMLFDHLKPEGILTVTRFYKQKPAEVYRLVSICSQTLLDNGINEPRKHISLVKCQQEERKADRSGTGLIMLSKSPLSNNDLSKIDSLCEALDFEIMLDANICRDSVLYNIVSNTPNRINFINNFPIDIKPPTDDKPFFFHLLSFTDVINFGFWKQWDMEFNIKAIFILIVLLVTMIILLVLTVFIPLKNKKKNNFSLKNNFQFLIYFSAIGFGFMFIEISQIQRLNIYLGHPTYSIAVALFTLLLSSGAGSYLSISAKNISNKNLLIKFLLLIIAVLIIGIITNKVTYFTRHFDTNMRIIVSILLISPIGFFMGMCFPIGMKFINENNSLLIPWLWAVNGAASVTTTVLAVAVAMNFGISYSYWTGLACYIIAFISFTRFSKPLST